MADRPDTPRRRRRARARAIPLVLAGLAPTGDALAKPPTLDALFPAGARRGEVVEVAASGTFEHWPVRTRVQGEGLVVGPDEEEKGKLQISVSSDARPGVRWIRIFDDEGASSLRPFLVGHAPETLEREPNNEPEEAEPIDLGGGMVTINGRLGRRGDVDGFGVRLARGQILVAMLEANRRLGSPMDAILQVASTEGFVLDENDDDVGLDPGLVFEAPADGTYVVRTFAFPATPNSTIGFAGDDNYIYRLTLSTAGFVDLAYPLALSRSGPGDVALIARGLPEGAGRRPVETDGTAEFVRVWHPEVAGSAEVRLVDHPAPAEGPDDVPDRPRSLPIPATASGRVDHPGDVDRYEFEAEPGPTLSFRVESRSIGLPLDPVLRLVDPTGKELAEVDDTDRAPDPVLTFKPTAAGRYRLEVRDLHGRGGSRFAYRLSAGNQQPDYRLRLSADHFTLGPETPLEVSIQVERLGGFDAPVEFTALGIPGHVVVEPATSDPKGKSAKEVRLTLKANGPDRWSGPIRFVGRASGAEAATRTAAFPLGELGSETEDIWLTVLGKPDAVVEPGEK